MLPQEAHAFKENNFSQPQYTVRWNFTLMRKACQISVSQAPSVGWNSTTFRDTDCSGVVSEEVLPDDVITNYRKAIVADYLGRVDKFPIVQCYLRCLYCVAWTDVVSALIKFTNAMIGNIPDAKDPNNPDPLKSTHCRPALIALIYI